MDTKVREEIEVPFGDPNLPKPKAIVLYPNLWEGLQVLSTQDVGWIFQSLFRILNGEDQKELEKTLPPTVIVVLRFIMAKVKVDTEKYQQSYKSRQERNARYYEKNKDKNKTS